jgi:hypothetical protein
MTEQPRSEIQAKEGDVIAVRPGGSQLVYTGRLDGQDMGRIIGEDGTEYEERPLVAILARGYWEAPA